MFNLSNKDTSFPKACVTHIEYLFAVTFFHITVRQNKSGQTREKI